MMKEIPLRLLIVDDHKEARDVVKDRFFKRNDILISEAATAQEALIKIQTEAFDLVLLDLRLHVGTDGLDILREIKQHKPRTGVIMFSGYTKTSSVVEAMRLGAIDFIEKEEDYEDIVALKVDRFIRDSVLLADRERNIRGLYETVFTEDSNRKGKALEILVAALFSSIEGFVEFKRNVNTETEEIDITFSNESHHPRWMKESSMILVECKNWSSKRVGKNEFVLFRSKMENRGGRCKLGFLICVDEFADTVTKEMLRSSKDDSLIVPVDGKALECLVASSDRDWLLRDLMTRATMI